MYTISIAQDIQNPVMPIIFTIQILFRADSKDLSQEWGERPARRLPHVLAPWPFAGALAAVGRGSHQLGFPARHGGPPNSWMVFVRENHPSFEMDDDLGGSPS